MDWSSFLHTRDIRRCRQENSLTTRPFSDLAALSDNLRIVGNVGTGLMTMSLCVSPGPPHQMSLLTSHLLSCDTLITRLFQYPNYPIISRAYYMCGLLSYLYSKFSI